MQSKREESLQKTPDDATQILSKISEKDIVRIIRESRDER